MTVPIQPRMIPAVALPPPAICPPEASISLRAW